MNLINKFFEKRKFIKETMERHLKRGWWDKKYNKKIAKRNWKIKQTRLKQEKKR